MLDALLLGTTTSLVEPSSAIELLRAQKSLHAYKLAESLQNAAIQLGLIGTTAGRQVVFDFIRMEELSMPLWAEGVNPATRTRQGFLIEAEEQGAWAVSTYAEEGNSYAIAARVLILKRDPDGSMRVQRGPTTRADGTQLLEIGESVMAILAIASAPMLTQIVDDKPPRRGMTRFRRIRMAEPWTDLHKEGIPKLGKTTRPAYVADEIMDEIKVLEGRIVTGAKPRG